MTTSIASVGAIRAPAAPVSVVVPSAGEIVARQRRYFESGATLPIAFRQEQLRALESALHRHHRALAEALHADLRRPEYEAYLGDLGPTNIELKETIAALPRWAKAQRVGTPWPLWPGRSEIRSEPYGVALVLSPWNYPVFLSLTPLLGSMAAGNCTVLKPSELAPATARALAEMIRETFDPRYVAVLEGGVEVSKALLAEKTDYVFFTGGTEVGRSVYMAAAKNLTPVTLELGGKSPCFVDKDVDLDVAANRIVWGKFLNCGQTCVAPDYILADASIYEPLLAKLREKIVAFYGDDPQKNPDYPRIINDNHHKRLARLIDPAKVYAGGQVDREDRYIAPTVLRDVTWDDAVMADEIFGPILPVLKVAGVDDAIAQVNAHPKPLALYVFTKDRKVADRVLGATSSGGAAVNDTIVHLTNPELPFGGVGASGIGAYHGKSSFDVFSHKRSVLLRPFALEHPIRYAPYSKPKLSLLRRVIAGFPS